jgi:hypothetical protein
LRALEQRQEAVAIQLTAAATAESHPNLPHVYRCRRKVEAPETALRDPGMAEALRDLINAILVFPSDECGETTIHLRGVPTHRGRPWCGGPADRSQQQNPRYPSGERRSWRSIGITGCGGTQPTMPPFDRTDIGAPWAAPLPSESVSGSSGVENGAIRPHRTLGKLGSSPNRRPVRYVGGREGRWVRPETVALPRLPGPRFPGRPFIGARPSLQRPVLVVARRNPR